MALKIIPKFTKEQLTKLVGEKLQRFNQAVFLRLARVGEQFVNNARNNHNYTDRTGNLTSSIGYIILKDGEQLTENFLEKPGPELKDEKLVGAENAKKVAQELARQFPRGFVLICVAGQDYSAAVESRGYDVITSSAITAKDELPKQLNELLSKIS